MSSVYLARDLRLDRAVAVKIFLCEVIGGREERASYGHFVQEAFALSRLTHPNTLRIYDFAYFEEDGRQIPFQVAEYMSDGTLMDLVGKRGPQAHDEAIEILECIAGALIEAHQQGLIHRDVKPSNILFSHVGRQRITKLADFSIALANVDARESIHRALGDRTIVSAPFCSPGWSAPEQARGGSVDKTADVFGLGMVFGFMLAGARVVPSPRASDVAKAPELLDEAIELGLAQHGVASPFAAVCMKACRARPELRFPNIEELVRAVRAARREIPARAVGPSSSIRRSSDRAAVSEPRRAELARVTIVLSELEARERLASGRPVRVERPGPVVDLDASAGEGGRRARFRVTWLPEKNGVPHLHLRGLNCFVAKRGGTPTSGIDIMKDTEIELLSTDRSWRVSGTIRLGVREGSHWVFALDDLRLQLPVALAGDVLLCTLASEPDLRLVLNPAPKEAR